MKLAKRENILTIKKLEKLMIYHGIVLRAIPERVINICEKSNIDRYPRGVIKYLEDYKREVLVVESVPQNASKFILEF